MTDGPLEENVRADCFSLTVRAANNEGLQAHAAGHSRVVDNLEAIPLFERQVVSRPRFVVVQRHEERHATCRRAEGAIEMALSTQGGVMRPDPVCWTMRWRVKRRRRSNSTAACRSGGGTLAGRIRDGQAPQAGLSSPRGQRDEGCRNVCVRRGWKAVFSGYCVKIRCKVA